MNQIPCSVCSEGGHSSRRCPALYEPLKNEFYKPSGGRPMGGDDEEDKIEHAGFLLTCTQEECLSRSFPLAISSPMRHWMLNPTPGDMESTWNPGPLRLSLSATNLPMVKS